MEKQAIYRDLAKYYNLVYSYKDYDKESKKIRKLISKYCKSDGKALLEVGCGTGKHAHLLSKEFNIIATDISDAMLRIARSNFPDIDFRQADMIKLDIKERFDAIICLYSSIGYVKTKANLKRTLSNFSKQLKTGGVIVIEPWFTKSTYRTGVPSMTTYDSGEIKIVKACTPKIVNGFSVMDLNYLIAEKGEEVRHVVDRHEMGLFEIDETLKTMQDVGFTARYLKNGLMKNRGLYVGVKT